MYTGQAVEGRCRRSLAVRWKRIWMLMFAAWGSGFLLRRKAVNAKTVQPLPAERVLATPPRILPHAISVCVFVVLEPFDLCS